MPRWLTETPWWLPVLLCGIGAVLCMTGNNRREAKIRTAGLAALLVGVLLGVTSYLLESDVERARRQSKELVAAVVAKDWNKVQNLMDPQVAFALLRGRDQLVEALKRAQENNGVSSATVTSMNVAESENNISINMDVISVQQATMDRPFPSAWRLDWVPAGEKDWKLIEVELISAGRMTREDIESRIPGAR